MKMRLAARCASVAGLVMVWAMVCTAVFAHHGSRASYDLAKPVTMKATVTSISWQNPHVFLSYDVKDDSGNVVHWIVEGQNPVSMTQIGWTKNTFKPGDTVEIDAMPAKNGNPVNASVPTHITKNVYGILRHSPPMLRMSCS